MTARKVIVAVAALLLAAGGAQAGIVNGGFETGTLDGWSVSNGGYASTSSIGSASPDSYEGTGRAALSGQAMSMGSHSEVSTASISQTISASAGDILSFQYQCTLFSMGTFDNHGYASVRAGVWNVSSQYYTTILSQDLQSIMQWQEVSYEFADGGTYELTFTAEASAAYMGGPFGNDTGNATADASLYVDDVKLVPEPATLSLVGLGLAGLVLKRGRKQSRFSSNPC